MTTGIRTTDDVKTQAADATDGDAIDVLHAPLRVPVTYAVAEVVSGLFTR